MRSCEERRQGRSCGRGLRLGLRSRRRRTRGLSAALTLGRARRRVLVLDSGAPREFAARAMHGVLGHDRLDPAALRARGVEELGRYGIEGRAAEMDSAQARVIDGGVELEGQVARRPADRDRAERPAAAAARRTLLQRRVQAAYRVGRRPRLRARRGQLRDRRRAGRADERRPRLRRRQLRRPDAHRSARQCRWGACRARGQRAAGVGRGPATAGTRRAAPSALARQRVELRTLEPAVRKAQVRLVADADDPLGLLADRHRRQQ